MPQLKAGAFLMGWIHPAIRTGAPCSVDNSIPEILLGVPIGLRSPGRARSDNPPLACWQTGGFNYPVEPANINLSRRTSDMVVLFDKWITQ